jgi:acyl-CoA reductase-like NAD-dependent aldehyde dehydrogenase
MTVRSWEAPPSTIAVCRAGSGQQSYRQQPDPVSGAQARDTHHSTESGNCQAHMQEASADSGGRSSFNFLVMIPLWMMPIPAPCRSTVILKASERTPMTGTPSGLVFRPAS